MLLSET
nr:unnamed protein product [Callosobruchus chinensis]